MHLIRALSLTVLAVAVLAVVGCGGSGDSQLYHSVSERASWGVGDLIAFAAYGGNHQRYIYRATPQGTNQTLLTRAQTGVDPVNDGGWHPRHSPDGAQVAFAARRPAGSVSIYRMDAREGDRLAVTAVTSPAVTGRDEQPNWKPDGTQIIFTTTKVVGGNGTGGMDIAVINPDGTGLQYLVAEADLDQWPVFSPDGNGIAFQRGPEGGPTDIIIRDLDTGAEVNITQPLRTGVADMVRYEAPDWGVVGDQEWIFLHSDREGMFDLYRIRPDGTDLQQLTRDTRSDGYPVLSPDGTRLLFIRTREVWSRTPAPGAGDERRVTRRF